MNFSQVSVIICSHNGAGKIIPTLQSLINQKLKPGSEFEILFVDNASTDNSSQYVEDFLRTCEQHFPYRIISEPKPGKAHALITGYNSAKHELMLLCDDDNWLQPDYLQTTIDIFNLHPDIGMLGGYGNAVFNPGEKPFWFEEWQNYFVCGPHHPESGFLKPYDNRIWGAGSVIRKTMWNFLQHNGFHFYNSLSAGKAMTEDAELSMAITFTGHSLYFDKRLWFHHDLRGGRITFRNLVKQQTLNGKNGAILNIYLMAFHEGINNKPRFITPFFKQTFLLLLTPLFNSGLKRLIPDLIYVFSALKELYGRLKFYKTLYPETLLWVNSIRSTYPLNQKT